MANFGRDENGALAPPIKAEWASLRQTAQSPRDRIGTELLREPPPPGGERPAKAGKAKARLRYSDKATRLCAKLRRQGTNEFRWIYRWRDGTEETNSLPKKWLGGKPAFWKILIVENCKIVCASQYI